MAYEIKDGQGSLFTNKRKETERHPDFNGSIKINGVEHWLSAWKKVAQSGEEYMSLALKPKQPKVAAPVQAELSPSKQAERAADFDDPIPF